MRTTVCWSACGSRWVGGLLMVMVLCGGVVVPAWAQAEEEPATEASAASVEELFADFLHFARLGRFTAADGYARALLAHPDLSAVTVLEAAEADKESVNTLMILVKNSSIGERAAQVIALIQAGEFERRRDPERIRANIAKLTGAPQQEYMATRHLAESGEYAIPWMVQTLLESDDEGLRARVITALPQIGKPAVNPLVMALRMADEDVKQHILRSLGEIGYPQAVPYLTQLLITPGTAEAAREAAAAAIVRIEQISGRAQRGTPSDLFFQLAEKYYDEDPSVRADPRLAEANVWYWDDTAGKGTLTAVPVPTRIFGQVMAMRTAQEALRIEEDKTNAIALWLTANVRRESRLGLDIENGDPNVTGELDATRPDIFPRALYYTQAAGPRYAHLVLERAVKDRDTAVALGAIEALRITAGESSLIGTEDYKQPLVEALQFPDVVVRTRAALALGAALPKTTFAGSEQVVPVLASALRQTGKKQVLVVDADEQNLNRVMGELRAPDTDVLGETGFYRALNRVRAEFQTLSAVYLSTDLRDPDLVTALNELRSEHLFAKVPVLVLVKPEQFVLAEEVALGDSYIERVDAAADGAAFEERYERIIARTGERPLDPDLALSLALSAAQTLRAVAADGRTVLPWVIAESALIGGLESPSEELQVLCAQVLAYVPTPTAQRSIGAVAMNAEHPESLRVAAFAALAESAKRHANQLEAAQVTTLVGIARDDDNLTIRTAASQALGALNITTNEASNIIRSYYRG